MNLNLIKMASKLLLKETNKRKCIKITTEIGEGIIIKGIIETRSITTIEIEITIEEGTMIKKEDTINTNPVVTVAVAAEKETETETTEREVRRTITRIKITSTFFEIISIFRERS